MTTRDWTRTVATAGTVGVLMCGCQSDTQDTFVWANYPSCPANAKLSESQRAALVHVGTSSWEKWATLASHVPGGFAGEYLIQVGANLKVGVSLVDTAQAAAALDSLAANWSIVSTKPFSFARESVTVRKVRWTFIELYDWTRLLDDIAFYRFGAWGANVNMEANRVDIVFGDGDRTAAMLRELRVQHVPCWLVTVRVAGPVTFALQ